MRLEWRGMFSSGGAKTIGGTSSVLGIMSGISIWGSGSEWGGFIGGSISSSSSKNIGVGVALLTMDSRVVASVGISGEVGG